MSAITLKNIPEPLHAALKTQAQRHGRSLNKEIICLLEKNLGIAPLADDVAGQAQAVRESIGGYLTQRELKAMKEEGRS